MTTQLDDHALQLYEKYERLAKYAIDDIQLRIKKAVGSLGDPYLVRAHLDKPRIKSALRLARKAENKGWSFKEALSKAQDLVGLRLVCHNLQDVRRAADVLEETLSTDDLTIKRLDFTVTPRPSGYRAIHLVFAMRLAIGKDEVEIHCEVQIRSLLQHSWAELSHIDVYAGDAQAPASIERRMKRLSNLLAKADATADKIRDDISRPRRGRQPQSGQPLTDSAIAYLYRNRFGEDPPDYLVRSVSRETQGAHLRSDGLHAALTDQTFMRRLEALYKEASGWEPDPPQLFTWAVHSLVFGKDSGAKRAYSEGRAVWKDIERIARREILSDVGSPEEMLSSLEYAQKDEDPESDIESWASVLGVSRRCAFCGTAIVDPEEFAKAAVKQFKVRGRRADTMRKRLTEAVQSKAMEPGSWDDPSICSRCAHKLWNE